MWEDRTTGLPASSIISLLSESLCHLSDNTAHTDINEIIMCVIVPF